MSNEITIGKTYTWPYSDHLLKFPEEFNWAWLESYKLTAVGENLARQCKQDFLAGDRNRVSGLRHAMIVIILEDFAS